MKLNTAKLEVLSQKEIEKTEGGAPYYIYVAGKWFLKHYPTSGGPEIEASYKYGQPGRRM
ncbi:hypothetical protein [Bacillus toyonensis]|uniref:hypothetical protein n=1 Tax=Bacillus toyonensis TaxID=155322 RepID=UPI0030188622